MFLFWSRLSSVTHVHTLAHMLCVTIVQWVSLVFKGRVKGSVKVKAENETEKPTATIHTGQFTGPLQGHSHSYSHWWSI